MNLHMDQTRLTLAEAVALDPIEVDGELFMFNLDLTNEERKRTSRLWLYLTGCEAGSRFEAIAGIEVLKDAGLLVMLNMPAAVFVDWFRTVEWDLFDLSDETGSVEWGWGVLNRARAICATMGVLATQEPLRIPAEA